MKKTTKPLPTFTAFNFLATSSRLIYDLSTADERGKKISRESANTDKSDLAFIQVDVSNANMRRKTERDYYNRYNETYHKFGDCNCALDLASPRLIKYMKANYDIPKHFDSRQMARIFEYYLLCVTNFNYIDNVVDYEKNNKITPLMAKKILMKYGITPPDMKNEYKMIDCSGCEDKMQVQYWFKPL